MWSEYGARLCKIYTTPDKDTPTQVPALLAGAAAHRGLRHDGRILGQDGLGGRTVVIRRPLLCTCSDGRTCTRSSPPGALLAELVDEARLGRVHGLVSRGGACQPR